MTEETRLIVPLANDTPSGAEAQTLPAVTSAEEMARNVVSALERITDHMALEFPHPETARRVRSGRTVSREFVAAMIALVETRPGLQAMNVFDHVEAREVLEGTDSIRLVADRVAVLLANLTYTMEARWARVARQALAAYSMANGLASHPDQGELASQLGPVRRHLGRTSRKKAKPGGTGGGG